MSSNSYNFWRDHISTIIETDNTRRQEKTLRPEDIPRELENPSHPWYVSSGFFTPKVLKTNYQFEPGRRFVNKPVCDDIPLPEIKTVPSNPGKLVVLLGVPASGKSSIVRSYFHTLFRPEGIVEYKDYLGLGECIFTTDEKYLAAGRYAGQLKAGLDSTTYKGPVYVQSQVINLWVQSRIDTLFIEGVHVNYLAFQRYLRRLQAIYPREMYFVLLDVDMKTQKERLYNRTGGLKYDRTTISPLVLDEVDCSKWYRTLSNTWENLKVIHRDDNEIYRGQLCQDGLNEDGTRQNSRHFCNIDANGEETEVLSRLLHYIEYPSSLYLK